MKKVLVLMTTLYNGGAERSLVNFLKELPDDKYEVDLLLFKREGIFLDQVPKWINIIEIPKQLKQLYSPLSKAGALMPYKVMANVLCRIPTKKDRVRRYYRWKYFYSNMIPKLKKEYDVALSYVSGEIMYFTSEKVKASKKYVWIHNDYRTANHPKKQDLKYFAEMDGIITISDKCADVLIEEFPQYKDKITILENITSSQNIREKADEFVPSEYDGVKNKILSIGRLSYQKGFDIALEAIKVMKDRGFTDFKWFIIGDGELKSQLDSAVNSLGIEEYVSFLGVRENPYPYIKGCDIFAQTSRFEGKSVVLDEAKILGKPIVSTKYPTVFDQIVENETGIICEGSPEGIAESLISIIGDVERQKMLTQNLKEQSFSNESEIIKYMKVIDGNE